MGNFQVSKNDFWFCFIKFLSSEVFPTATLKATTDKDEGSVDVGSETQDRTDFSGDDEFEDSEKSEDEPSNFFEFLHSNFAPSRRLKPALFDSETLVLAYVYHFSSYIGIA